MMWELELTRLVEMDDNFFRLLPSSCCSPGGESSSLLPSPSKWKLLYWVCQKMRVSMWVLHTQTTSAQSFLPSFHSSGKNQIQLIIQIGLRGVWYTFFFSYRNGRPIWLAPKKSNLFPLQALSSALK